MAKNTHEIRDPVHGFISFSTEERDVINSEPVQRLRHIHQLAMGYLLYPGATHKRFEHSLGVMHLATRIFDEITNEENRKHLAPNVRDLIDENIGTGNNSKREYWRSVVRMGALCHDIGHLPFSHGAEVLLPKKKTHEWLTWKLITSPIMENLWKKLFIPDAEIIAKIAIGPKEAKQIEPIPIFQSWEALMAEIVVGNAFGADRLDYLLRDSHHAGVSYGLFDLERLIKTLRFLPKPAEGTEEGKSDEPQIGLEKGGMHIAEAMLLARYFMFTQVYFHHVRKVYDLHLQDFMKHLYPKGLLSKDEKYFDNFLATTDNEILAELRKTANDSASQGYTLAERIVNRKHFRKVYELTQSDYKKNPDILKLVKNAIEGNFPGNSSIRIYEGEKKAGPIDFPVRFDDERIFSAVTISPILEKLPDVINGYIYVEQDKAQEVKKWLKNSNTVERVLTNHNV